MDPEDPQSTSQEPLSRMGIFQILKTLKFPTLNVPPLPCGSIGSIVNNLP
jgi:hypothetical protein